MSAFDNYVEWLRITSAITLTSCPVVALPCELTEEGLPVGMQLVGRPRGEWQLLSAAAAVEQVFEMAGRVPHGSQGRLSVVGRFAPSPSGPMHLGNARTALLAWLDARARGGGMLLRIEDLDRDRCRPEYAQAIRDDLAWLGLDWDAETRPQSQRDPDYAAALERLSQQGLVYECFCTRRELAAVASAPHGSDDQPAYPGTCRDADGRAAGTAAGRGETPGPARAHAGGGRRRCATGCTAATLGRSAAT